MKPSKPRFTYLQIGGSWHVFDNTTRDAVAFYPTRKEARAAAKAFNEQERARRMVEQRRQP